MDRLLRVSEARQRLLETFGPVEANRASLLQAVGRVLAEAIFAPGDLPSFPNSTMDGFALRASSAQEASPQKPALLRVVGDIAAGQTSEISISEGQAVRIMTGAVIPAGADGVVPVEDTDFNLRRPGTPVPEQVQVYRTIRVGENIRPRGMDVRAGQKVLEAGQRLRPQELGLLAMMGGGEGKVYRRPRLAILSTGDELLPPGEPLRPGNIYDSNAWMLAALIEQAGGEALELGIAADRAEAVESLLDRAEQSQADLILSSAGVSVGSFDFVREVVEKNGRITFWRVNMRPGKPLAFGVYRKTPFIGLPGNPVSAFVGFEVFVRPALMKLAGLKDWKRPVHRASLIEAVESDGRESYLRGTVHLEDGRLLARLTGHQGSGNLFSLVQANALLIVPSGVKSLPVGAEVDVWMLDGLFPGN